MFAIDRAQHGKRVVGPPHILQFLGERVAEQQTVARRSRRDIAVVQTVDMIALRRLFAKARQQVVRARMQQRSVGTRCDGKQNANAGSAPNAPTYRGFFTSLRDIVRREGASGLYKGMVPNVLRTLPSSGVTFMVYESVRSFLGEDDEARRR